MVKSLGVEGKGIRFEGFIIDTITCSGDFVQIALHRETREAEKKEQPIIKGERYKPKSKFVCVDSRIFSFGNNVKPALPVA